MPNRPAERLGEIYRQANRMTGGVLAVVRDALDRFGQARGSQAAAGLAYYAVFSLFPLLLVLIVGGTLLLDLERAAVRARVLELIAQVIPVSSELIARNIDEILEARETVGIIGVIGALWSGSGALTILGTHLNRAWPESRPRGFLRQRLVAFAIVGTLGLMLAVSVIASTGLNLLSAFQLPLLGRPIDETVLSATVRNGVPWLLTLVLFLALYRWVPNVHVGWSWALWSAVVAAVLWELAARGFAFYVRSGLARYEVVYGSLATVVGLMFWAFLGSWIVIFGAHLGVAIAYRPGAARHSGSRTAGRRGR